MKNTFKYILPLFLLSGCGDDFLDLTPHSSANVEDFYNTPADIEVAVNGVYRTLQMAGQYGQSIYTIGDVASDNCIAGRPLDPWQDIAMHRIPSTNGVVENSWNHNYQGIQAVNTILNRVDEVEFADQSIKNRLVGEVKFLRALMYFNLVRIYGAVPLVLSETRSPEEGYTQGRDPETQVYEQIMRDLSEAASEGSLPVEYSSSDIGRATRGAALALMGKVHMTLSNYSEAANYLKQVIDLGVYRLLDDYADIFEISNANHAESIFEVQYKSGTGQGLGSGYFHTFSPFTAGSLIVGVGGGAGLAQPTAELMAAYEEGDLRRDVSLQEGFVNEEGEFIPEPWISKYIDPAPFQPSDNNNNWIVMRYADILLMYAEALNE
jgi:starch-binding outer membrane protein, SusD/RagB family